MSKKENVQSIILLRDDVVAYLSLGRDDEGFFVVDFEKAELEPGVIEKGEILKADFLQKVLFAIRKKLKTKHIHLLLPHAYFEFDTYRFLRDPAQKLTKQIDAFLEKKKPSISWAETHSYEYEVFPDDKNIQLLFRTLRHDLYLGYQFLFRKAGFLIDSVHSDKCAFESFLPPEGRASQIIFGKKRTHLIEYKDGRYLSENIFNISYDQLIAGIKKELGVDDLQAQGILQRYGLLRSHPEKKLYTRLQRMMRPLVDFLGKQKHKQDRKISVYGADFPVPGFVQQLQQVLPLSIEYISFHEHPSFPFHEVLSLHKKDSYFYEPLIARALSLFTKKK